MRDLGTFMRGRFARYLHALRSYAEESGITGVPFVVNIHGTDGGMAETFPIGISQLMDSYSGVPGMLSGTDIYLGELTVTNAADLYLVNAFCDAVHDADQPLTSVEFEAGTGDYGCDLSRQYDPSAVDLKTRMCLAQGNKLLNYYLFAGGVNPPLDEPAGDGNDRIAFTGERHGFAAPVDPEGRLNPVYGPTTQVLRTAQALAPHLAAMREEHDDVAIGFVPDHYLTEYHYPGSASVQEVLDDVVRTRGAGAARDPRAGDAARRVPVRRGEPAGGRAVGAGARARRHHAPAGRRSRPRWSPTCAAAAGCCSPGGCPRGT